MRLRALYEGFRLDTAGLAAADVTAALRHLRGPRSLKATLRGRSFVFSDSDTAADVVLIEPARRSAELSRLSLGAEGTIYYAFATVPAATYRDRIENDLLGPLHAARAYGTAATQLRDQLRYLTDPSRYGLPQDPDHAAAATIQAALTIMAELDAPTVDRAMAALRAGVLMKYAHAVAFAFVQRLKHPGPEDVQLVETFMGLVMDEFMKMSDAVYDYVTYPQSSSGFNRDLADRLADLVGGVSTPLPKLLELPKLPAGAATVDRTALYQMGLERARRAGDAEGTYHFRGVDYPTPEAYADAWAGHEFSKLETELRKTRDRPPSIKDVSFKDKRHAVNLFEPPPPELAGATVLLIDDNLDSGGTLAGLAAAVRRGQPARLDVFVPLVIK